MANFVNGDCMVSKEDNPYGINCVFTRKSHNTWVLTSGKNAMNKMKDDSIQACLNVFPKVWKLVTGQCSIYTIHRKWIRI